MWAWLKNICYIECSKVILLYKHVLSCSYTGTFHYMLKTERVSNKYIMKACYSFFLFNYIRTEYINVLITTGINVFLTWTTTTLNVVFYIKILGIGEQGKTSEGPSFFSGLYEYCSNQKWNKALLFMLSLSFFLSFFLCKSLRRGGKNQRWKVRDYIICLLPQI